MLYITNKYVYLLQVTILISVNHWDFASWMNLLDLELRWTGSYKKWCVILMAWWKYSKWKCAYTEFKLRLDTNIHKRKEMLRISQTNPLFSLEVYETDIYVHLFSFQLINVFSLILLHIHCLISPFHSSFFKEFSLSPTQHIVVPANSQHPHTLSPTNTHPPH